MKICYSSIFNKHFFTFLNFNPGIKSIKTWKLLPIAVSFHGHPSDVILDNVTGTELSPSPLFCLPALTLSVSLSRSLSLSLGYVVRRDGKIPERKIRWISCSLLSVLVNVARHMPAYQSCDHDTNGRGAASLAVDGNYSGLHPVEQNGSVTHTCEGNDNWWAVDLGQTITVSKVALTNRLDCCREFHYFHLKWK